MKKYGYVLVIKYIYGFIHIFLHMHISTNMCMQNIGLHAEFSNKHVYDTHRGLQWVVQ